VDAVAEERLVAIIDAEIAEVVGRGPVPLAVLDALLDLRLRVVETVAFEWIEREVHDRRAGRVRGRRRKAPAGISTSPTC
jgi:hypothetical protein